MFLYPLGTWTEELRWDWLHPSTSHIDRSLTLPHQPELVPPIGKDRYPPATYSASSSPLLLEDEWWASLNFVPKLLAALVVVLVWGAGGPVPTLSNYCLSVRPVLPRGSLSLPSIIATAGGPSFVGRDMGSRFGYCGKSPLFFCSDCMLRS